MRSLLCTVLFLVLSGEYAWAEKEYIGRFFNASSNLSPSFQASARIRNYTISIFFQNSSPDTYELNLGYCYISHPQTKWKSALVDNYAGAESNKEVPITLGESTYVAYPSKLLQETDEEYKDVHWYKWPVGELQLTLVLIDRSGTTYKYELSGIIGETNVMTVRMLYECDDIGPVDILLSGKNYCNSTECRIGQITNGTGVRLFLLADDYTITARKVKGGKTNAFSVKVPKKRELVLNCQLQESKFHNTSLEPQIVTAREDLGVVISQEPHPVRATKTATPVGSVQSTTLESANASSPMPTSRATDFRKAKWGMTRMEIAGLEAGQLIAEDSGTATYKDKLYGLDAAIIYSFENDQLIRGTIVITQTHGEVSGYLTDFNSIKSLMTAQNGKPAQDGEFWKNEQFKESISQWGQAILQGHLVMYAKWFYPGTSILLQLSGENGKVKLGVQYKKEGSI